MDRLVYNPARYDNKISERYFNLKINASGGWNNLEEKERKIEVASCWDGSTIYTDLTRGEFMELSGASENNVSLGIKKGRSKYKNWIYSKEEYLSEEEFKWQHF